MEADGFAYPASNKFLEANLANCQKRLTTGVTGVSEFVEIGDGTQEIQKALNGVSILSASAKHEA
ncbi:hypothetical protein [Candidatus Regiella insecticola]|uniref:hypothetical protein n=1 Tax=Candidatus Regiella insecticola TaxID=138073 RepID=UPI0005880531|nr:hypothetical protein [Candidatus Regiella insecticola]